LEKLDAADEDFIPNDANRNKPLEKIGKKLERSSQED
jgi:hypothetical protein